MNPSETEQKYERYAAFFLFSGEEVDGEERDGREKPDDERRDYEFLKGLRRPRFDVGGFKVCVELIVQGFPGAHERERMRGAGAERGEG